MFGLCVVCAYVWYVYGVCVCVVCECAFVVCVVRVRCVCVCVMCFYYNLFRHAPLKYYNSICIILYFGKNFITWNAVTWSISGIPLHLNLQHFEHLKHGVVQFVKSL